MESVEAVLRQAAADLDAIGARWAVIGGLAMAFRAEPRFTKDVVHTSLFGKDDGTLPRRYDASTKAKAIRLVRDHAGDYPTEYAAITAVASRLAKKTPLQRCSYCHGQQVARQSQE